MTSASSQPEKQKSRDAAWAAPVSRLTVSAMPSGAINLNVDGRQLTGPLKGFGQLWQKTYRVRLSGAQVSPSEVIKVWKEHFPEFWPKGNRFYGSLSGIAPGEVAVLNLAGPGGITGPKGMPLISTGVMVIYADEESFSFMTPDGHMFAGMITFSAEEDDGTLVQIQVLIRASDPIYEIGCRLGIVHRSEDAFWRQTLENLAAHFDVDGYVQESVTLVDPKVQWSEAKNIWHNAAIRTGIYYLGSPIRWVGNLVKK
ncbi:MAG: hypothetical protein P8X95_03260 [Anaerolineales bacterium]|jgi:hypothetical protein